MRTEKTHLVNYVGQLLGESDYVYFISYGGLKVKDFENLRGQIAKNDAKCRVLKNTVIMKAVELFDLKGLADVPKFNGSTAVIFGNGDPSRIAKLVTEFGKSNDLVAAKGGYFEKAYLTSEDVTAIASLPSREVLYAQLLGVLQGPARGMVTVLNAKAASILNVLNAYKDKLEKQA